MDHYVRINQEARTDIEWWHCFLTSWNGTAMMFTSGPQSPDATVTSDASGTWGCGAYLGKEWFMLEWTESFRELHITVKELAPIVIAAIVWGLTWRGMSIRAKCDNSAVVAIVNSGSSRNPQAMIGKVFGYLVGDSRLPNTCSALKWGS